MTTTSLLETLAMSSGNPVRISMERAMAGRCRAGPLDFEFVMDDSRTGCVLPRYAQSSFNFVFASTTISSDGIEMDIGVEEGVEALLERIWVWRL
jgi:hypothetical protein